MRIAIHQPHYFPWLGYMNKMAKVDRFVLMDEVQLTDKSNMFRNQFLTKAGSTRYLTVCFVKKGYMEKPFCEVELNPQVNWQKDHVNFLKDTYRKAPYFEEIWPHIEPLFEKKFSTLYEVDVESLTIIKNLLAIPTEIILQSDLDYDRNTQKNELVLSLCQAAGADEYLSGNGARKYMDLEPFDQAGVHVEFQQFSHPVYPQIHSEEFVPNLSSLDLLFNCGIEQSRRLFHENARQYHEFGE